MYKYFLILIALLVLIIRISAPSDLHDNDQVKPAEYIQDLLERKHFFYQVDRDNNAASKPPLYIWLAALPTKVLGYRSDFALKFPSILSMIGLTFLIVLWGNKIKDQISGVLAAIMMWASYIGAKMVYFDRTDMLLTFWIVLAQYCLFQFQTRSYENNVAEEKTKIVPLENDFRYGPRKWWLAAAWVSMAMGTLTKGPVALCIPVFAWLTFMVLTRDWGRVKEIFCLKYFLIYLAIVFAWFIPALIIGKEVFFTRVIMNEMVDRFFGTGPRVADVAPFWLLWPHFIDRFLPWSLFFILAVVLWFKGWRFCSTKVFVFFCSWILGGLILFSLFKGKHPNYVLPLEPAAAFIVAMAAVESMRIKTRFGEIFRNVMEKIITLFTVGGGLVCLGGFLVLFFPIMGRFETANPLFQNFLNRPMSNWLFWGGTLSFLVSLSYFLWREKVERKKGGPLGIVILALIVVCYLPVYFFTTSRGAKEGRSDIYKSAAYQIENIAGIEKVYYRDRLPGLLIYFLGGKERCIAIPKKGPLPPLKQSFILILSRAYPLPSKNLWKTTFLFAFPEKKGGKDDFGVYLVSPGYSAGTVLEAKT